MLNHENKAHFQGRVNSNQQALASKLRKEFDYIVCGSGTSGSVVAGRLAVDRDVQVLVLEAGGSDESDVVMDPNRWPTNLFTDRDWGFIAEPDIANPQLLALVRHARFTAS